SEGEARRRNSALRSSGKRCRGGVIGAAGPRAKSPARQVPRAGRVVRAGGQQPQGGGTIARRARRHPLLAAGPCEKNVGSKAVAIRRNPRLGSVDFRERGIGLPESGSAGSDGPGGVGGWVGPGQSSGPNRRSDESHVVEQTQDYRLRRGSDAAGRRRRD